MIPDPFAAAVVPRTAARPAEAGADRPASATFDHKRLTWIVQHHNGRRVVCLTMTEVEQERANGSIFGVWRQP